MSSPPCPGMCGTTWVLKTSNTPLFHVLVWWHGQVEFLKAGHNIDDIDAAENSVPSQWLPPESSF